MDLILDTNIWVAYMHDNDSLHEKARNLFELLNQKVLIPEYVLVETLNILSTKVSKEKAEEFIFAVAKSNNAEVIWSSMELREEFLHFFVSNKVEKLSFVDQCLLCLSKNYKILTFDKELARLIK
jgi:predicted nucleic acid-binding protein